ncbi:MAG: prepilin-type N-terminal cleavage/methylation domain-containing protein [Acidimicrobiales bacterium]
MSFVERCRQRHLGSEGGDEGFTLIELLVVLLIIGILLAIAIPTFLSVTKGANNTAAQSNLQNALTGAKTYFTDSNQSYTGIETSTTTSNISQIGTGLTWVSGGAAKASTATGIVSAKVTGTNGSALILVIDSAGTHTCWVIVDNTVGSTTAVSPLSTAESKNAGTWFGSEPVPTAGCVASTSMTVANFQTTGFPS